MKAPLSWSKASPSELKKIEGVCLDIDDTLSTDGKLTAQAFQSLWALKDQGFLIVPITGRPAGWCDHIARFWPVDAVVGENGAFTFYMDQGVRKKIITPKAPSDPRPKLNQLWSKIKKRFPFAKVASDQAYREYDLAIDICEDVRPWKKDDVQGLLELCKKEGALAKLSSIHVNTWFGHYDKCMGFNAYVKKVLKKNREWIFIGDSPNDEPMFSAFHASVGVSNLTKYLPTLKHPPRWITSKPSGAGFSEMAQRLLSTRLQTKL